AVHDSLLWQLPAKEFRTIAGQYPALRRVLAHVESTPLGESDQIAARAQLAQLPFFAKLAPDARQALAAMLTLQHVAAGERIYTVGQSAESLYLIEDGEVVLS